MSSDLQNADSRLLHEPFAKNLAVIGPHETLAWLVGVLATQSPSLRSSNSFLVAYTGCPEAIDWLETAVATPVSAHWGQGAALLGTPWARICKWLAAGGPLQLMALDALIAYRSPSPNMAPLAQIAAPVLPDAPSFSEYEATVMGVLKEQSTPRIRKAVESSLAYSAEILTRKDRAVPVADLPLLFLQPDLFPSASEVLGRHDAVISGMRQSVQNMLAQTPPRS